MTKINDINNTNHKVKSLQRYLAKQYIGVLSLLLFVFLVFSYFMNLSTMDDTSEYYMLYEAEVLTEFYHVGDPIAEFDQGRKEYYWQYQLPERYKQLIFSNPLKINRANLYQLADKDLYILPFIFKENQTNKAITLEALNKRTNHQQPIFYVVHLFDKQLAFFQNKQLQSVISLLIFVVIFISLLFIWRTNRLVAQQMSDFQRWMRTISDAPFKDEVKYTLPKKVTFSELTEAANILITSLENQYTLHQQAQQNIVREKAFLASLSHELRSPITIIAAAVSLIKKRNQLNEQDLVIIEKLAKANTNMQQLAQILLQLWRRQKKIKNLQKFSLLALVQQEIEHCKQTISRPVKIHICSNNSNHCQNTEENNDIKIYTDKTLIQIVISNVLRNACLYSEDANVNVNITANRLKVSNSYQTNQSFKNNSTNEINEQTYGFGLYIVDEICQQYNWQYNIQHNANCFTVQVVFD